MKAAVIHQHGGPECVKVEEVPEPKPLKGEIVLQVKSCGLNHLDIWVRKDGRGGAVSRPHILGSDAAGTVAEVGKDVLGVKTGDEAILNPGLSCGHCENCRRGENSQCEFFGIIGMNRPGTFAEQVVVPARNVYPKPAHMSFDEAGAFVLSCLTAWRMLITKGELKPGQMVLIHGTGGGVALYALQLAKMAGAGVIVTSSSDEKLSKARQMGANYGINYKTDNVAERVRDITAGQGVDIVIDTVGTSTWETDFSAVRRGGKIILCGVTSGHKAETNLQALYWRQLTVMGSTMGSEGELRQMLKAVNAAKLKPVIDSVRPLDEVREAMSRMEEGGQFGKIVLKVSG